MNTLIGKGFYKHFILTHGEEKYFIKYAPSNAGFCFKRHAWDFNIDFCNLQQDVQPKVSETLFSRPLWVISKRKSSKCTQNTHF